MSNTEQATIKAIEAALKTLDARHSLGDSLIERDLQSALFYARGTAAAAEDARRRKPQKCVNCQCVAKDAPPTVRNHLGDTDGIYIPDAVIENALRRGGVV